MLKKILLFGFMMSGVYAKAQVFINGSFESWGVANVCEINVSPDGWTNYSTGCSALDEANQLLCTSTIPGSASNGNIYARACAGPDWQGGEGIYQMVSNLNPGQQYVLSFDYAGSNLYGGTDSVLWRVYVDDTLITQTPYYSSLQSNWITFNWSFIASQNTHKIGFRSYFKNPCVTCAGSAGIDNMLFAESTADLVHQVNDPLIQLYPNPVDDYLMLENLGRDRMDISVYDLTSKIFIKASGHESVRLNTQSLPSGMYACVVRKKGVVVYKKMINVRGVN